MADVDAVVLLSGGLDSLTCAGIAAQKHRPSRVLALSLYYGQKHEKELRAAEAISEALGLQYSSRQLPVDVFRGAGSALVDPIEMPEATYEELQQQQGPGTAYVPFRNANLLSVATAIALTVGAEEVYFGAHATDAHNWAYPDCTPEFVGAMANAIYVGTYHKVRLVTPLLHLTKAEVVRKAAELKLPLHLTWSCYNGREKQCGKCPTCLERINAFRANGLVDPVPYEIEVNW